MLFIQGLYGITEITSRHTIEFSFMDESLKLEINTKIKFDMFILGVFNCHRERQAFRHLSDSTWITSNYDTHLTYSPKLKYRETKGINTFTVYIDRIDALLYTGP